MTLLLSLHPNTIFERCRLSYNNNLNSVIGILPSNEKRAQREDIQLMLISNYRAMENNFTPYHSDVKEAVKHRKARPQTLYVIADEAALDEGTIVSYPAYCRGRRRLSQDQYREAFRIMNMPSLSSHSKIPGEC